MMRQIVRILRRIARPIVGTLMVLALTLPAVAATTLTVQQTPMLTWGVVGLDSNDVNTGPNLFLQGARACNTGSEQATGVEATLTWDSSNPYIDLQNPTGVYSNPLLVQLSYGVLNPTVPSDVAQSVLDPGQCFDFYFNVEIQRNAAAYDTSRRFHITVSASNAPSVSTPTPREVYVEHLISQSRNKNIAITGPASVWVGGIFTFTMTGQTTTNGYDQIDMHIVFPNTVFQVISSYTTYTAPTGGTGDSVYKDACGWDPDPTSPTYRSCTGTGKYGGTVYQTYNTKILDLPPGSTTLTLNGTIYDFSGSSYHYNSNYNGGVATWDVTVSPTPTLAELGSAEAIRHGDSIAIRWNTAHEVNNLGFHVWREVNGVRTRITPAPIAGSAFLAGPTVENGPSGYDWFDHVPESEHPLYWIESLDLRGTTRMMGPIRVREADATDLPSRHRPVMLGDLARMANRTSLPGLSERAVGARGPTLVSREKAKSAPSLSSTDLASMDATKIVVRRDGWKRVSGADLLANGLAAGTKSRGLRLFADGEEIPIVVNDGGDGKVDSSDSISFYGEALDTPSTDGRVYWLVSGSKPGERAAIASGGHAADLSATSFPFTVERKDRILYFAALGDEGANHFFGPLISTVYGPATQTLDVEHLDDAGTMATLTVRLQGVSESLSSQEDHRVRVDLNGTSVGEVVFDGRENVSQSFDVPASMLHDGSNVVTLTALQTVNDPVNWYADSLVDRVDLSYPHTYEADGDWLRFSAPGASKVTIRGFSSADVTAVDVTDPLNPIVLPGSMTADGDGYDLTVTTPAGDSRIVVAMTGAKVAAPSSVVANAPSSWNDRSNAADFVIITNQAMMPEARELADRRSSEGWSVATVDVQDLYDEFDFGAKDPVAIRSFLENAYDHWRTAPGYVLFLGDASVDPRNYLGYPDRDVVPTHFFMTSFSEAASDEWFVDFDGDGVGEMAIGRLPAGDPSEAGLLIGKTLQYESADVTDGWNRRVEIVAGTNDPPGLNDFVSAADGFAGEVPAGFDVTTLHADDGGVAATRSSLISRWSSGAGLVAYFGHGTAFAWGRSANLFSTGDASALRNGVRLPVVEAMTCLSGWFYHPAPWAGSVAEKLLENPSGGAVAVWASSGSTNLASQIPASEAFLRAFAAGGTTLGEAARSGKAATSDGDVRGSWILFGDPTLVPRSSN